MASFGLPRENTQKPRPGPITLISLFEFVRAGFILVVAFAAWAAPNTHLTSRLDVKVLTYVAARRNLPPAGLIQVLMPLIAAFLIVVGCGLWFLKKWARNTLMITSGMTVVLWIKRLAFDWAIGAVTLQTELQRQIVYFVIIVDALIFGCLAFWPDVSEAFDERN
jgi:hypothetical protein